MAYTTCAQEMKGWENSPHGSFSAHTPNINPFAENKTKKINLEVTSLISKLDQTIFMRPIRLLS